MASYNQLQKQIMSVVNAQLKSGQPPYVKTTYKAYVKAGFLESEAREAIAAVLEELLLPDGEESSQMKDPKTLDLRAYEAGLRQMLEEDMIDM